MQQTTNRRSDQEVLTVRWFGLLLFAMIAFAGGGCQQSASTPASEQEKPILHGRVAATNFAIFSALRTICDEDSSPVTEVVYCGPPSGADPHSWMPSLAQIRDLQKVDLIVCNGPGAQFSTWLDKVTIDERRLLPTTDAMKLEEFVLVKDYQLVHSHGPQGEHSHAWVVPQSWLSPRIARKQAVLCYQRIVEVYGAQESLDQGLDKLAEKFDRLEAAIQRLRKSHPSFVVASSTPEVSYLTCELGWDDHYLQLDADDTPASAVAMLKGMRARSKTQEQLFLSSGVANPALEPFVSQQWKASVEIDLIETPRDDGLNSKDYFERMAENLEAIRAAIE